MKKYIALGTLLALGGCAGSPFGGSGVVYEFSNTPENGCSITIRKSGDSQTLAKGNVIISSKDKTCSVAGGISDAELTGKDSAFAEVVSGIVEQVLEAKGL